MAHSASDLLLLIEESAGHGGIAAQERELLARSLELSGLVTLEDVIEELIGDFDDESDRRVNGCEILPDGRFRVAGTMRADDFVECTGVELPDGDWQTVAGFVIDALDEIPSAGDRVDTEIGEFEVVSMDGYAIEALLLRVVVREHHVD